MEPGEWELVAVRRELAEEAGYGAGRFDKLCSLVNSKGVVDETAHIYRANGLRVTPSVPDATEFLDVRAFPFDEVLGWWSAPRSSTP